MANAKKDEATKDAEATTKAPVTARPFTKAEHDARATEAGERKTVGKHSVEDLKAGLLRNGSIPPGVSYSPYSKVPFVEVTDEDLEAIRASQRAWDDTVSYPNAVAVAVQAGTSVPTGGVGGDASTPGNSTGTGDAGTGSAT